MGGVFQDKAPAHLFTHCFCYSDFDRSRADPTELMVVHCNGRSLSFFPEMKQCVVKPFAAQAQTELHLDGLGIRKIVETPPGIKALKQQRAHPECWGLCRSSGLLRTFVI